MAELSLLKQREIPLTLFEKGITAIPTAYSPLMDEADWWAAKTSWNYLEDRPYTDAEKRTGAERIIDALWSEEKTHELRLSGVHRQRRISAGNRQHPAGGADHCFAGRQRKTIDGSADEHAREESSGVTNGTRRL